MKPELYNPPNQENVGVELLNTLDEIISDARRLDSTSQEVLHNREGKIETLSLYEQTLKRFIERYGCDIEVKKIGKNLFSFQTKSDSPLEDLPDGFAYKGGSARSLMRYALSVDREFEQPRDIDLANIDSNIPQEIIDEISEKYSPDDYTNGYGVERLSDNYFGTRDFTMNEVLAYKDNIYCTKECLLDTVRNIIRFSKYEVVFDEENSRSIVNDKLMAKAVRFVAEAIARNKKMEIQSGEFFMYQNISAFHIALHLDRALASDYDVAKEYILELSKLNQLPEEVSTVEQAVEFLRNSLSGSFVFRSDTQRTIESEEDIVESVYDEYDKLAKREPFSKRG